MSKATFPNTTRRRLASSVVCRLSSSGAAFFFPRFCSGARLVQLLFRSKSDIRSTSAGCCVDADMPCDDYWIQRWTALVRKVLRWRAPTRRTLSRKRRDAATRAAISADVASFLGVMRAERALATEQRPGQTRGSEATSGSEG